jgi:hypothetical protein
MSKITYNTQGQLVTQTLKEQNSKYLMSNKIHVNNTNNANVIDREKLICQNQCANSLSLDFISNKLT